MIRPWQISRPASVTTKDGTPRKAMIDRGMAEVDLEGVCDAWELCDPPVRHDSAAYWATLSAHEKAARVAVKLTSYVAPERSVDASHQGPHG